MNLYLFADIINRVFIQFMIQVCDLIFICYILNTFQLEVDLVSQLRYRIDYLVGVQKRTVVNSSF